MQIKTIVSIVALLGIVLMTSAQTNACSCAGPLSPMEAFERADFVLSGKVKSITADEENYRKEVEIAVAKVWKGEIGSSAKIFTALHSAACGYYFREGEEYLIYAYRDNDGTIRTSICTRTALLKNAAEDLQFLDGKPFEQPSGCCGSIPLVSGDTVLFLGMIFFFRRRKSKMSLS